MYLSHCDMTETLHLEEFIEGAGNLNSLPPPVVRLIAVAMPAKQKPSLEALISFSSMVMFLRKFIDSAEKQLIWSALLSEGPATTFPAAICSFQDATLDDMAATGLTLKNWMDR
ncbi:hypothetical protein B0H13DRAFT_2336852 [Mycena leptocephala]|nr:hypothetical protein B0H13DRAFT_2336852 [Mycena leptocephala]